jgi:hypothetical protein
VVVGIKDIHNSLPPNLFLLNLPKTPELIVGFGMDHVTKKDMAELSGMVCGEHIVLLGH